MRGVGCAWYGDVPTGNSADVLRRWDTASAAGAVAAKGGADMLSCAKLVIFDLPHHESLFCLQASRACVVRVRLARWMPSSRE